MLLTLFVAVTGAYIVTRLVTNSLEERLANQLLESGRVVSDLMARQEVKHVEGARLIAFTRGMGEALQNGDAVKVASLAEPAAGGLNAEDVLIFDAQGKEKFHSIKQVNGQIADDTRLDAPSTFDIVTQLLAKHDPNAVPMRAFGKDPIDGRYYYFTTIPVAVDDQVVGAVVVGTSVNTIMPLLKNTALADVIFYSASGQAIATTLTGDLTDKLFVQTISIPAATYQTVIQQDSDVQGENLQVDGRWYRIARAPLMVSKDRLAVFAVILPLNFVLESGSASRTNYAIVYSVAMVLVVVIGYFVARLIVNPISTLVRASRAIASGDLTQRTQIKSRDEIGVLSNTFDDMTQKLQDRTMELEKTNRILEQMDRTKMRFIQVSAHELRTPMTLVQGYAQMAELKSAGNADMERYTKGILEGTTRMVEVIDSMLDVSRIDSNLLDISPSETQLDQVIEKVRKAFGNAFEDRKLKFNVQGLSELPVIQADKDLLFKVFYHVVGNAIKYTPDGGSIMVSGCQLEDPKRPEVEIAVKDTGIGVDPQYQELIFEKFYQTGEVLLHSSGKTKFKGGGPGLGLAISRGIINAHKGRIWLESQGHDEKNYPGSTVFVRLAVNGRNHENA